jgi:uncharacterized cupin superfamily protein
VAGGQPAAKEIATRLSSQGVRGQFSCSAGRFTDFVTSEESYTFLRG